MPITAFNRSTDGLHPVRRSRDYFVSTVMVTMRASRLLAIAAVVLPALCNAASPYDAEQSRSIKALSEQEVSDYLTGEGMGLAKAAELNGYPGPAHVLELTDQLALTTAQKQRTEQVFGRMQARARELGARLIDEERKLDELFASKTASRESVATALRSIASIQSEIRAAHLQAHLEEAEILTTAQIADYWHLRGYAAVDSTTHHKH